MRRSLNPWFVPVYFPEYVAMRFRTTRIIIGKFLLVHSGIKNAMVNQISDFVPGHLWYQPSFVQQHFSKLDVTTRTSIFQGVYIYLQKRIFLQLIFCSCTKVACQIVSWQQRRELIQQRTSTTNRQLLDLQSTDKN